MNSLLQIDPARCPHALLFVGKALDQPVEQLAALLKVSKADLHHYHPEGKTAQHPIASIRKLIEDVSLVPFEGEWKLFVMHEAEKMLPTSANALLKTLEEPTKKSCILLLSAHPEKLLVTIRSRCQMHTFLSSAREERTKILAYLTGELKPEDLEGELPELLWETIMLWYRDRHLLQEEDGEHYLSFPEHREKIASLPYLPLPHVEKVLAQARLAQQRSFKLPLVLEMMDAELKKAAI